MAYRNKKWYVALLKGMSVEKASAVVSEYLQRPSFMYELQNANAAFREVFGMDYASPAEMRTLSDREEIARLKAQLEAVEIEKKKAVSANVESAHSADDDIPDGNIKDDLLTAEQFKDKWIAENGADVPLKRGRAWAKYKKENGIVE